MVNRSGANLALLLLGGFRSLANAATEELARRGYEDFRPVHDFAMRAIAAGADSASELGRRLSVSKQAAAKTISVLEDRGYIEREPDASDARRKHLKATSLGF
jgi:DNA-binding MarR family transcriptional regulator